MTKADKKLRELERSINAAESGKTKIVHCPYCNTDLDFSPPPAIMLDSFDDSCQPPTCCPEFALGVIAILQRKEQLEMKEVAERIQANVGGPKAFVN